MVTGVPAVMVIMEKVDRCCKTKCCDSCEPCVKKMRTASETFWGKIIPPIILKPWPLWLILFLAVGIGGAVLVFVTPKLTPPKGNDLKIFYDTHPFQYYINEMYSKFTFELDEERDGYADHKILIFWGIKPSDFTSTLDPDDKGTFELEPTFDLYSQEGQEWMLNFINELLNQPFMPETHDYVNAMEVFKKIIEGPCTVALYPYAPNITENITPCCELNFPVPQDMAKKCYNFYPFYRYLLSSVSVTNKTIAGAPVFNKEGTEVIAFSIIVTSNRTSTDYYYETKAIYEEIDGWVMDKIRSAPLGLEKGFWSSGYSFDFYDLQTALADGTYIGIGLALGVGFLVLLATSMNVFLTIYAIATIALVILSTIGVLVLAGWELGSFESLSITLAVGLSIDFTIHYGIGYKMSEATTRPGRVTEAVSTVGFALTMAAMTTFLAGSALMGGRVVGYRNFGVFLMTCMSMSWLFSTFFFLPLCRFIGPLGSLGDLMYLLKCKCRKKDTEDYEYPAHVKDPQFPTSKGNGSPVGQGMDNPIFSTSPVHNHNNSNIYLPGFFQAQVVRGERHGNTLPPTNPSISTSSGGYYSYQSGVGVVPPSHMVYRPHHQTTPAHDRRIANQQPIHAMPSQQSWTPGAQPTWNGHTYY